MYDSVIGIILSLTIRLEDLAGADVTGKVNGDLTVKKTDKDDTDWVVVAAGNRSLEELSEGDYTLKINANQIDTLGFYRAKISCAGCVTKQYAVNVKLPNFSDGAVHCDLTNGTPGFTYPIGTRSYPASTVANALDLADTNKLHTVKAAMYGNDETISASGTRLKHKTIKGLHSPFRKDVIIGTLGFSGSPFNLSGSFFKNLRIAGVTGEGQGVKFEDCYIETGFNSDDYILLRCILEGNLTVTGFADLLNCLFLNGDLTLSSSTAGDGINLMRCAGKTTVKGMTDADNFVNLDGFVGDIIIDSSCTLGTINIRGGSGKLTNNSGGTTVNIDGFYETELTVQQIRDAMKLAPTAGSPASGSVDEHLDDIKVTTDKFVFTGNDVHSNVRAKDSTLGLTTVEKSDVNAEADQALADYDGPTKAEMDTAHALLATPAQVNAQCLAAITTYDPPTRTEATADKDEILVDTLFLKKVQINKKDILLEAGQYYLYIYDNDDTTPIAKCLLEKFGGGAIGALGGTTEPTIRNRTSV
jgi:hypothetical protein